MRESVYISGPISNRPKEEVTTRFAEAALYLSEEGFHVKNPAEILPSDDFFWGNNTDLNSWEYFMRQSINLLMKCEGIYMLEGCCFRKAAG